jgi:hypothetical protein
MLQKQMSHASDNASEDVEDEHPDILQNISYKDDLRIAAYIQRTELMELRRKREAYIEYKNEQKNKMVKFLSSIFMKPIETPYLDENNKPITLVPKQFSVFEGFPSDQIPTVDQIRELKSQQRVRQNIFEDEEDTTNREEHERLMHPRL